MTECYACAKLAELRAENSQLRVKVDELVNGNDGETNGIRADVPLVDNLPDGDAVEILRKSAKGFQGGTGNVIKNAKMLIGMNVERGLDIVLLETLADMVERDYVRRAAYNSLKELTTNSDKWLMNKLEEARAERDELRREVDRLTRENISLARDLGECMAERDGLVAEIDALEYRGELDEPRGTKVDINGEVAE